MGNELISIIVPIYNIEDYVKRCVNSLTNQKYKNIEILLIDDGSKDFSGKICDELAISDSRIKVFHKENGGLSDARNYGIDKSSGRYITTVDGDDFVNENYISDLYKLLVENDADISSVNRKIFYENIDNGIVKTPELYNTCHKTKVFTSEEYLEQLLKNNLPHEAWAKLYKRELFQEQKYQKGLKMFEDLEFIVRVLDNKSLKIVCNTSIYDYFYRVRSSSIMRERYNDFWEKELEYYNFLLNDKRYSKYKSYITQLLCNISLRNLDKIIDENEKYSKMKKLNSNLKNINVNYCDGKKKKMKIFLVKYFPMLIWWALKIKRKDFYEMYYIKKFETYRKNSYNNNQKLHLIFNAPVTGNLGDHAILFAEEKKLSDDGIDYFIISSKEMEYFFKNKLYEKVSKDDNIYITGGGNTGTLWRNEQVRINEVLDVFKNNKITIFPQTIYYSKDEFGQECFEKDLKYYKNCTDIEFQCRERQTFDFVSKNINIPTILTKDIALTLDYSNLNYNRSGVLFCFRNDSEKSIEDSKKNDIINKVKSNFKDEKCEFIDTVMKTKEIYSYIEAKREFNKMIKKFASSNLVVTDRLHGMIFAKITNTPCIALDNLSGKVRGVYETIRDENPNIFFAENGKIGEDVWKKLKDL